MNRQQKIVAGIVSCVVVALILLTATFFSDFLGLRYIRQGGPRLTVRHGEANILELRASQQTRKLEICTEKRNLILGRSDFVECRSLKDFVLPGVTEVGVIIPKSMPLGRAIVITRIRNADGTLAPKAPTDQKITLWILPPKGGSVSREEESRSTTSSFLDGFRRVVGGGPPSPSTPPATSSTPSTPALSPTVDLKVNGSDYSVLLRPNTAATLSWTSSHATTCQGTGGLNSWSRTKPLNGSESTGNLSSTKTFYLTCRNASGSAQDSVTVNVTTALTPTRTPTLTPTPTPTPTPTLTPTPPSVRRCIVSNERNIRTSTKADLVWNSIAVTPTILRSGNNITVQAEMQNIGSRATSSSFYVAILYDKNRDEDGSNTKWDDTQSDRRGRWQEMSRYSQIAILQAGAKRTFKHTITNTRVTSLREHLVVLILDLNPPTDPQPFVGRIDEVAEGNNDSSCTFEIYP